MFSPEHCVRRWVALGSALALAVAIACDGDDPTPTEPAASGVSPLAAVTPVDTTWTGVVETRLTAGSYTYLAVRDAAALRWVATTGAGVPEGTHVIVRGFGVRENFRSPRLDRTFAELVFAVVEPAGAR